MEQPEVFTVIDKQTGTTPNMEQIALSEEWAKDLVYCDMEDFALLSDGTLMLLDECGNWAYCPPERFEVRMTIQGEHATFAVGGEDYA